MAGTIRVTAVAVSALFAVPVHAGGLIELAVPGPSAEFSAWQATRTIAAIEARSDSYGPLPSPLFQTVPLQVPATFEAAPLIVPASNEALALLPLAALPFLLGGGGETSASGPPLLPSGPQSLPPISVPPEPEPIPAVPEPSTWAMLLAGFAASGLQLRRRRVVAP